MTDNELRDDVQKALDRDPALDAGRIAVSVRDSVVALTGDVKCYRQKATAERLAFAVQGVRAVANDVNTYSNGTGPTDADIAHATLSAIRRNTVVPDEKITVSVSDRWVTLDGWVNSDYQRMTAGHIVRDVAGVHGVTNNLRLESAGRFY